MNPYPSRIGRTGLAGVGLGFVPRDQALHPEVPECFRHVGDKYVANFGGRN